jgi:hypothetical protein
MSPIPLEPLSILAIDIGTVNTRAFFYDVVEESYHLVASAITKSTHEPPLSDVNIGILNTVHQIEDITGRILLNQKNTIIVPSQAGSEGVDRFYISHSFGPFVKIATFGLSSDVSSKSINKLAATTYGTVVESISLNDKRTINEQVDAVVRAAPDMIFFAGGTDRGSSRAVKKMANLIASILQLMPQDMRPLVIFSGNQSMIKAVKDHLGQYTKVANTVNIRPAMDDEHLIEVANELADLFTGYRGDQYSSIKRVTPQCSDSPCPSAIGLGRIVQFLSEVGDPEKGIMAVDLGSGSSTIASACNGKLDLNVFPAGIGATFEKFLETTPFEDIARWFPAGIDPEEARNQLWQKTAFPRSIPETSAALTVEQAAVKQLLNSMMRNLSERGLLVQNGYDTILCSGMTLTQMGTPEQLLMMLLDGLQPIGLSSFVLDQYSMLASLGAAARLSPLMPVQLMESSVFTNLATVVSVRSSAKPGTTILRARVQLPGEQVKSFNIKQGSLTRIPVKAGVRAAMQIIPTRQSRMELTGLTEGAFRINGGVCGLVIDARGRPITFPKENGKREPLLQAWTASLQDQQLVQ